MARLYVLVNHRANKVFKSDSQRLAVSLRSSIAKRCSHLNAALCASPLGSGAEKLAVELLHEDMTNFSYRDACPIGYCDEILS